MKKILALVFVFLVGLGVFGCSSNSETLTVLTPAGAPAIAQVFVQASDEYEVDVVNGPDPLVAALTSGSHDFVFAPTNLGAKLYTSGIEYKFLAAVTFGNYYLVSAQEEEFTIASLEGKEIVVFGQNSTSDIIIQYILDENGIEATLTYVDSVASANGAFILDDTKIIMTAEPSLSVLANTVSGFQTIDLQDEYEAITGEGSYPQAGVFGKTTLTDRQIRNFLNDLEDSIDKVNNDIDETIAKTIEFEYGFSEQVLQTAIPNCHLEYVSAIDAREALEAYFEIILELNGVLIGNALPEDGFYYQ